MPSALPNLLQRLAWVAFLGCTAWLAAALPEQPVDAQNRSLKSPTSRDAERLRELAAVVPTDPVVLVAFTAPGDLELPADQRQQIAALTEQVRQAPPSHTSICCRASLKRSRPRQWGSCSRMV
jgi:hypothetical protein